MFASSFIAKMTKCPPKFIVKMTKYAHKIIVKMTKCTNLHLMR